MHSFARFGAALAWLFASTTAVASDDAPADLDLDAVAQDDDDDLFSDPDDERSAVESGEIGDTVGARDEEVILVDDEGKKKTVIKTIQRKNFLKLGRFEASPHAAFVANDPFLNRYIFGTGLAYHVTEIFAVESTFDFAPDLGEGDWKPLTTQLVNENSVSPDISKLTMFGSLTFQYSPIYGKVAIVGRDIILFDIYGNFGMGFTRTVRETKNVFRTIAALFSGTISFNKNIAGPITLVTAGLLTLARLGKSRPLAVQQVTVCRPRGPSSEDAQAVVTFNVLGRLSAA